MIKKRVKVTQQQKIEIEYNLALLKAYAKNLEELGIKDFCPLCKADLPLSKRK